MAHTLDNSISTKMNDPIIEEIAEETPTKTDKKVWWGIGIGLGIFVVGFLIFVFLRPPFITRCPIDPPVWGTFGDSILAAVGCVLAFLSIILLNDTLKTQAKSNGIINKSNVIATIATQEQSFENSFNMLFNIYLKQKSEMENLDIHELRIQLDDVDYLQRTKEAKATFLQYYTNNRSLLVPYYRVLYRIFQTVEEEIIKHDNAYSKLNKNFSQAEKEYNNRRIYENIKMLRCQLTDKELLFIKYNGILPEGEKMQKYINKYNMIKHLPFLDRLELCDSFVSVFTFQERAFWNYVFISIQQFIIDSILSRQKYGEYEIQEPIEHELSFDQYHDLKVNTSITSTIMTLTFKFDSFNKNPSISMIPINVFYFILLEKLLHNYMYELFVFNSYQCYQKIDEVDITITKHFHKDGVCSLQVVKKNQSTIVLSAKQVNQSPIEKLEKKEKML